MRSKDTSIFPILGRLINEQIENTGIAPTVAELANATGLSKTTVSRYLTYMREHDMIDSGAGHRSIITKEAKQERQQTVRVPVLGAVSCGIPKFAEENIEEYVRLPISLFGNGDYFLLRANGDSMIEAGINHGDLVLIRQQPLANAGQIVVALIEDEATLKRFYPEEGRVRLHPENHAMEDIYVDTCAVQGVAVKVLKDLE